MRPTERDLIVARAVRDACFVAADNIDGIDLAALIESLPEPAEQPRCRCGWVSVEGGEIIDPFCPVHDVPAEHEQAAQDADAATAREQLDARERSSRNLAHYAQHNEGFDAVMMGSDITTRDTIRTLYGALEVVGNERANAQKALIYLAREAGGSPPDQKLELDRYGLEIRAALRRLYEANEDLCFLDRVREENGRLKEGLAAARAEGARAERERVLAMLDECEGDIDFLRFKLRAAQAEHGGEGER